MGIIHRIPTDKSFPQAVADLKEAVAAQRFGVLWEMNFKDKLQEKGLTLDRNFQILEVCNPVQAKRALETRTEIGFFLPCRMAVFEEGGQVWLGMLKPTEVIGLVGDEALSGVAAEVEASLHVALENAR